MASTPERGHHVPQQDGEHGRPGAGVRRDPVAAALDGFPRRAVDRPDLKRAAVGIVLVTDTGVPALLLTRRAARLRGHPGQWALPGGRAEPGEPPGVTARRELHEELGLALGADTELGLLDDYATRSGYVITPVVLRGGTDPPLRPNPDEVAELHRVPLQDVDVEPRFHAIPESAAPVIRLPLFGGYLHAPTAALLHQFREVVLHGRATRVAHLEQPVFAWR